ncbi:MAG: hypothetical protein ACPGMQ_11380 [Pirellulales bacterium]
MLTPSFCLPSAIADLLAPDLPPLGPGAPQDRFEQRLGKTSSEILFGATIVSPEEAECCLAGMWLWNGFLDRSHEISQNIDSPEGSWWHGIMHRREPDAGNAAYWFRRVGDHSLFSALGDRVQKHVAHIELPNEAQWLSQCTYWKPQQFIEACESARCNSNERVCYVLREVAAIEWYTLFDYCRNLACGNDQ